MNPVENFRAAMRAAGLDYAGLIHTDGKLHRFKAAGDHEKNSWYVLHPGPPVAGAFGCWKRGIKEKWCEKRRESFTDAEWRTIRENWNRAEAERERTEKERHTKARKVAAWILNRAKPAQIHPYLERKGAKVFGDVREYRGALVLPLRDTSGELQSLQFIVADGEKRFLSGGKVAGCFFAVSDRADGTLLVCEGYATGASIFEATGFAVLCAMNCGNLLAVSKVLRNKFPQREIVVAADDDRWKPEIGNPGFDEATKAAKTIHAKLAVPQFTDTSTKPTDFNDLHQLEGLAAVKTQIENATPPKETDTEAFDRLAKLPPADYDRCRDDEAKRLNVRVTTLDNEVTKRRPKIEAVNATQGSKVSFPDIVPWDSPVNGAALLNEIVVTLRRFVIASESGIIAASLFVLHTYAFDLGDISPILFITGPTKRCGKSRLLSLLARLVHRALATSSVSAAGIYRTIELHRPTLLIDEVDAFLQGDDQLRGLINSGHTRDAAFHLGCVAKSDDFEPRRWSTWTPKIFSGIGRLADTLEDRAVIIKMMRRRKNELCERLRHRERFEDLQRKCAKFVADHAEEIKNADPHIPDELNDRAADNWLPLLALADLVGGDWSTKARQAAVALSGGDDVESLGLNGQLLADIWDVFAAAGADKLASKDMAERLAQIEGRPWAEFGRQRRPISPNQLANLLRGFGVSSGTIRFADGTAKGYDARDFSDAFSRYLPGDGLPKGNKVTLPVNIGESRGLQEVTTQACDVSENEVSANKDAGCDVVTDQKPLIEEFA